MICERIVCRSQSINTPEIIFCIQINCFEYFNITLIIINDVMFCYLISIILFDIIQLFAHS